MGAAAGAVVGGLGLVQGAISSNKASKQHGKYMDLMAEIQRANLAMQSGIANRQMGLFDLIKGIVQDADAQGQFDPQAFIRQLEGDSRAIMDRDANNMASAMRISGFTQGDSEITNRMDAIYSKGLADFSRQNADLRRSLFMDKVNAYGAVPGGILAQAAAGLSNSANSASNAYGQMSNFYGSQVQNPANLIGSIMPFLNLGQQAAAGAPQASATANPGSWIDQWGSNPVSTPDGWYQLDPSNPWGSGL